MYDRITKEAGERAFGTAIVDVVIGWVGLHELRVTHGRFDCNRPTTLFIT